MYSRFKSSVAKNIETSQPSPSAVERVRPHVVGKITPHKPNEQLIQAEAKIVYLSKVIGFASTQSEEAKNAIDEATAHYATEALMGIELLPAKAAEKQMSSDELIDQHGIEKVLAMCRKWVDARLNVEVSTIQQPSSETSRTDHN